MAACASGESVNKGGAVSTILFGPHALFGQPCVITPSFTAHPPLCHTYRMCRHALLPPCATPWPRSTQPHLLPPHSPPPPLSYTGETLTDRYTFDYLVSEQPAARRVGIVVSRAHTPHLPCSSSPTDPSSRRWTCTCRLVPEMSRCSCSSTEGERSCCYWPSLASVRGSCRLIRSTDAQLHHTQRLGVGNSSAVRATGPQPG